MASIQIHTGPFKVWTLLADYEREAKTLVPGRFGACASFTGTMRDFNQSAKVQSMVIEHYPDMTERELQKIADDACTTHDLLDALLVHRVGPVLPGDTIVLVAAWSAHRAPAFAASREMMEALKSRAPFWKKETLAEGERWVGNDS